MTSVEQSIDVDVRFASRMTSGRSLESFPSFMDGVEEVRQIDDTHLHWRAKVAGHEAEWMPSSPNRSRMSESRGRRRTGKPTPGS